MVKGIMKKGMAGKIMIVLLLVLLGLGATFAWFTVTASTNTKLQVGTMEITVEGFLDESGIELEPMNPANPDHYRELTGTIKNTGTLPVIISLENIFKIKKADGVTYFTDAEVKNVLATKLSGGDYGQMGFDGEGNLTNMFATVAGKDGTYLLLTAGASVSFDIAVCLDGNKAGIEYMNSLIQIDGSIKATQTLDEALISEFAFTNGFNDLNWVILEDGFAARSVSAINNDVMAQLKEIFHQN